MVDIDGGLHPAVDGQSLDEDEDEEEYRSTDLLVEQMSLSGVVVGQVAQGNGRVASHLLRLAQQHAAQVFHGSHCHYG